MDLEGSDMTTTAPRMILRANAVYLGLSAAVAFLFLDVPGIALGWGPEARLLANAPLAGIGFVEAHGLAFILSVHYWRAATMPTRAWHLTAGAVAALLGTANVVFWRGFVETDALAMGYLTTSLHWTFAIAQLAALLLSRPDATGCPVAGAADADAVTSIRTS
jgi:hypothetical protein